MEIVSVSLDNESISNLNLLVNKYGFAGSSEAVRTSLNLLIKEKSKINQVKGNIESVLLILHEKKSEQKILDVFHETIH